MIVPDLIFTFVWFVLFMMLLGVTMAAMHTASSHARGVALLILSVLGVAGYLWIMWLFNAPM